MYFRIPIGNGEEHLLSACSVLSYTPLFLLIAELLLLCAKKFIWAVIL